MKDHELDFRKIKRGICLFEFFKKDSCSRKSNCHFTHQIPPECLSDPNINHLVLKSIAQFKNKTKIKEILGDNIVQQALALTSSTSNSNNSYCRNPENEEAPMNPQTPTPLLAASSNLQNRAATTHSPQQLCAPQHNPWNSSTELLPNHLFNNVSQENQPVPYEQYNQTIHPANITPFLTNLIKELISKESQLQFKHPLNNHQSQVA